MMGRCALLVLGIAAASGAATPALAQCRLCAEPTADRESPSGRVVAIEIEASLDFDRLILLGAGQGSAILRPDGSSQISGAIGAIGARAMVGQARVRGEPGRLLRIMLPRRIELHSLAGGRITIEEIATDLPSAPRLDSSGALTFRFGGRLEISGDAEGDYRGDVPITVEYL
jgi:hypothetical protein